MCSTYLNYRLSIPLNCNLFQKKYLVSKCTKCKVFQRKYYTIESFIECCIGTDIK